MLSTEKIQDCLQRCTCGVSRTMEQAHATVQRGHRILSALKMCNHVVVATPKGFKTYYKDALVDVCEEEGACKGCVDLFKYSVEEVFGVAN